MSSELIIKNIDLFGIDVFEIYRKSELTPNIPPEICWMYIDYSLQVKAKLTSEDDKYLKGILERMKKEEVFFGDLAQLKLLQPEFQARPEIEFFNFLLSANYCFYHKETLFNRPIVEVW